MLKRNWTSTEIVSYEQWLEVKKHIPDNIVLAGFDTETTGLHIKLDVPFLFQFGYCDPIDPELGYTFLIDLRICLTRKQIIQEWLEIAKSAQHNFAHNVKFDMHMLDNINIPVRYDNLDDLMFYIRYGTDAVHVEEGGAPLQLKPFAARYIDANAKYHEKLLDNEKTLIAKQYNAKLKNMLIGKVPDVKWGAKSYTLSVIQNMFKDPLFDISDLPEDILESYLDWLHSLPIYLQEKVTSIVESDMIRYDQLSDKALKTYAHLDIVYLLEGAEKMIPLVEYRKNTPSVELERSLILPFFDMESTGFLVDKEYLEESRIRIREYALKRRKDLYELAGEVVSIGQHARIKQIFKEKFNAELSGTGNEIIEQYKSKMVRENPDNPVIKFIDVITELRTLEKWYPTYILRFQKDLKHLDRLYTQINQVQPISGRVSSDFQQFPKVAIKDNLGNELFHPRRIVKVPPNCKILLYLDYSQIELRFQAMYTILVGTPDMNMCRAYMPYKCHRKDGTQFDYNNIKHIKSWNSKDWYLDEDPETLWTPTDLHGATTLAAFPGLTKDDENFHMLRYVGKRTNFAKNYGASLDKVIEMFPEYSYDQCKLISDAYYTAFPGVKNYHQYCFNRAKVSDHTTNLFGCNYYNANGHKLRNLLVQGSAAHFLKIRIRRLWEFLTENNLQSRLQLQIHDELVFEINNLDPPIAKKLKAIMEDWDDAMVPVVAEAEITKTTWADKEELEL